MSFGIGLLFAIMGGIVSAFMALVNLSYNLTLGVSLLPWFPILVVLAIVLLGGAWYFTKGPGRRTAN